VNIQIPGAMMLLAAALLIGAEMRRNMRVRIRALENAIALAEHFKQRIELFNMPLNEIYKEYIIPGREECLSDAQIEQLCGEMGEGAEILRDFFAKLGENYRADALGLCTYTLEQLRKTLERAKTEYPSRLKLCTALPILISLSLIILIL